VWTFQRLGMQAITATRRIAKQDLKRSIVTESGGIPLGAVPAAANRRDDGLLAATLDTWSWSVCCPPSRWCTWTPATTTSPAGRSWPNTGWSARSPREACRYQSRRAAAAGGAHPRLGQPGRQAALVHRAPPAGGGVLAGAGQAPSSCLVDWCVAPGSAAAGKAAHAAWRSPSAKLRWTLAGR
jgi:hypothetical protein